MAEILETAKTIGITLAEIVLIIYFCIKYINVALRKEDISQGVKHQSDIDLQIIERMDYYKELLGADRIFLFEFHNGQHYSNYRSALRMSPSYEVFRAGLESKQEACTNLPISIMPKLIYEITHNGLSSCKNIAEIKEDMGNTYEFNKALGIHSYYDVAIRDESGNVIGFVAVEWGTERPKNLNEEHIQHLAWFLEEKIKELAKVTTSSKKRFFGLKI